MRKILPLIAISLFAPLGAETAYTIPQGYTKITIPAAPSAGTPSLTAISATLLQDVEFAGTVTIGGFTNVADPDSPDTQAANVSGVTWTTDQWTTVPHLAYLTVADDPGNADGQPPAEKAFLILGNSNSGGLTLATRSDLLVNFPASSRIKIRKATTLKSLFASGEAEISDSDRVYIWDEFQGNWGIFNYIPDGGGNWLGDSGLATNMVVHPDEGLFYERKTTTNVVLTLFGEVPSAPQIATIEGTGFLSSRVPVDTELQNLGIHGPNWQDGDRVYLWSASTGLWDAYLFIPDGGGNWILNGGGLANDRVIAASSAVFVVRQASTTSGDGDITTTLPYDPFAE